MTDGSCTIRSNLGSIVFRHVINEMMAQLKPFKTSYYTYLGGQKRFRPKQ